MNSTDIIHIIGTAAFTVSGYLVGFRKRLDVLGVIIVSLLTAIGGGMLRDVLIGRIPQVFLHSSALTVIFLTLMLAWLLRLHRRQRQSLRAIFISADAIGLAAFSITGAQVGLGLGLNLFGVLTLGFVTAVGGGIVRDTLVNDVPLILRRDFYGSIALLSSGCIYLLHQLQLNHGLTINLVFVSTVFLRLWVHRQGWGLPGFQNHT